MKRVLLFLLLLSASISFGQFELFKSRKSYGIRKKLENGNYEIVAPAQYDKCYKQKNNWIVYNKPKDKGFDGQLVNYSGKVISGFNVLKENSRALIYQDKNGVGLYSYLENSILYSNYDDIKLYYYYSYGLEYKFTELVKDGNNEVYLSGTKIYLGKNRIKQIFKESETLLMDNNDLYNWDGKLLDKNVKKVFLLKETYTTPNTKIYTIKYQNENSGILIKDKVLISNVNGYFRENLGTKDKLVLKNEKGYWFYDLKTGSRINQEAYQEVFPFKEKSEKIAIVKKDNKWILIDGELNTVKSFDYENIEYFGDNYSGSLPYYKAYQKEGDQLFEVTDVKGNPIFPQKVSEAESTGEYYPVVIAKSNGKYAIGNLDGNSGFVLDQVSYEIEESVVDKKLYVCEKNGKAILWLADTPNKFILEELQLEKIELIKIEDEEYYSPGIALFKNGKLALAKMDKNTVAKISDFKFDKYETNYNSETFDRHVIILSNKKKKGWYDAESLDTIVPFGIDEIVYGEDNYFHIDGYIVRKDKKNGFYSNQNKGFLLDCKYDEISEIEDYLHVEIGGKYGVFNTSDKTWIIEPFVDFPLNPKKAPDFETIQVTQQKINGKKQKCIYTKTERICFEELVKINQDIDALDSKYIAGSGNKFGLLNIELDFKISGFDNYYLANTDTLIAFEYDEISEIPKTDGILKCVKNGTVSLFSSPTLEFIKKDLGKMEQYKDYLIIEEKNKWGLIDSSGFAIIDSNYDSKEALMEAIKEENI